MAAVQAPRPSELDAPDPGSVTVRPIQPDDAIRLVRMSRRLSPETVYKRFFTPVVKLSGRDLYRLVDVDHDRREALVALHGDEIIGVVRYDVLRDGATAEWAAVVEDAWQGRGVGRRLVSELTELAQSRGVRSFTATMLPGNRAALGLARSVFPGVKVELVDGLWELAPSR